MQPPVDPEDPFDRVRHRGLFIERTHRWESCSLRRTGPDLATPTAKSRLGWRVRTRKLRAR
jgi:hypothetical protein